MLFLLMLKKFFFTSLTLMIIYILISQNYIYQFFVPNSGIGYFADWDYFIKGLECEKIKSDCETFNYGKIFSLLPYEKNYDFFYSNIVPITLIVFFVFIIFNLIEVKTNKDLILALFLIFNPSTLLILERANNDILFFCILFFISYSRLYHLNFALISFSFLGKYYPITFSINFFLEKKSRKIKTSLALFLFFLIISMSFILINFSDLKNFLGNSGLNPGYHYLFSVKAIPKVLKYILNINYIFLLVLFYSLFIYISIKIYAYLKNRNFFDQLDLYRKEDKLFILGTNTLVLCFLLFSNWYYREVFLIFSIPLIILLKEDYQFARWLYNILILRYLFLFLYSYLLLQETHYHLNGERIFHNFFLILVFLKGLIDFIIMAFLSGLLINYNLIIFNQLKTSLRDFLIKKS